MTELRRKALIIGLDGATWDVIDPLLSKGDLPHIGRLVEQGVRAHLRSTIPPVTAAAWPSIVTGMNPGKHGIFRFETLDHEDYDRRGEFNSSDRIAGRTIFDYVGGVGERVLAAAVPMTYPAWPINGRMVSGYPTPRPDRFYTYPPEWADEVLAHIQTRQRDQTREKMDTRTPEEFLSFCERVLDQMSTYLRDLMRREDYGLVMVVTGLTDNLQHRFFNLRKDGTRPNDPIDQIYRLADRMIGRIMEAVDDDWLLALVSDHGAGPRAEHILYVNTWLHQQGLLFASRRGDEKLARGIIPMLKRATRVPGARRLWRMLSGKTQRSIRELQSRAAIPDWERTQAYYVKLAEPAAGINVNLRGREPNGIVEPGEQYERVRDQLLADLPKIHHSQTGKQVVVGVWRREELYSGPNLELAPDVIFLTDPEFEGRGGKGKLWGLASEVLHTEITGHHRIDGILTLSGRGVFRAGQNLDGTTVTDFAPTLLHGMGLPIPANMDGRTLAEAFEASFWGANPVRRGAPLDELGRPPREYSQEEEAGIASALRSLGYVE